MVLQMVPVPVPQGLGVSEHAYRGLARRSVNGLGPAGKSLLAGQRCLPYLTVAGRAFNVFRHPSQSLYKGQRCLPYLTLAGRAVNVFRHPGQSLYKGQRCRSDPTLAGWLVNVFRHPGPIVAYGATLPVVSGGYAGSRGAGQVGVQANMVQ